MHDFAAPEVVRAVDQLPEVDFQRDGKKGLKVAIASRPADVDSPFSPFLVPGDFLELNIQGSGSLEAVVDSVSGNSTSSRLKIRATLRNPPVGTVSNAGKASLTVTRSSSQGSDLFSLGMLLVALLTRQVELKGFREGDLPIIRKILEPEIPSLSKGDGRDLINVLKRSGATFLLFSHLEAVLERFGAARVMAEELFGIALRCTLRGPEPVFYLPHRSSNAVAGLQRLRSDVDRVRRAVTAMACACQGGGIRRERNSARSHGKRSCDPDARQGNASTGPQTCFRERSAPGDPLAP